MPFKKKKIKLSKKELEQLAEALKKAEKIEAKKELKNSKLIDENKFITPDLNSRPRFVINNLSLSNRKRSAQAIDNLNFPLPLSRSESGINLEKISPVLKPVARASEGLEQKASSFLLQKRQEKDENNEKPYELGEQKYFSQSDEYKTIDRIQAKNLQISTGVEKSMSHRGFEQSQKRKSERFFEDKPGQEYSADIKPLEEIGKREKKMYTNL